jgi:predicted ester cyclase
MSSRDEMVGLVEKQHAELWSRGNLALVEACYADDFVGHFPGCVARGHEGIRSQVISHRATFPDWREEVLDVIVEGDNVVTRFRSSGTDRGGFQRNRPTGRKVSITEVCIFRVRGRKISEQWVYPDIVALQSQLGATADATKLPD